MFFFTTIVFQIPAAPAQELPPWKATRNLGEEHSSMEEMAGLPNIGSRVRRGKDWTYGNEDGEQPGTVIGHYKPGKGSVICVTL